MECEEHSRNDRLWEIIVTDLNKKCDNEGRIGSGLEDFLEKIKDNLTFDDSGTGLYPHRFIASKNREELEHAYTWLLNKLLFIHANDIFRTYKMVNFALQKDLISASLMKQPWWTEKSLKIYCDVLHQINSHNEVPYEGIPISVTTVESYPMKLVTLNYQNILVQTQDTMNELGDCCIQMLTHGAILMSNIDENFVDTSCKEMFRVLQQKNLRLKYMALIFFIKLAKSKDHYDDKIKSIVLRVFDSITLIYKDLPYWLATSDDIKDGELRTFNDCVRKFYLEVFPLKIPYTIDDKFRLFHDFFGIVQIFFENFNQPIQFISDELIKILVSRIKMLSPSFLESRYAEEARDKINIVLPFVQYPFQLISMFDFNILSELQSNFHCDLLKSSSTWKVLYEILLDKIKSLSKTQNSEDFMDTVMVIQQIFRVITNVDYKFLKWHQKEHIKLDKECFCHRIDSEVLNSLQNYGDEWDFKHIDLNYFYINCNDLLENMLTVVTVRKDLDIGIFVLVMNTFEDILLKSAFGGELNQNLRTILLSIIVAPFYKCFKSSSKFSSSSCFNAIMNRLPDNFKYLFDQNDNQMPVMSLQRQCLDSLSKFNMSKIHPLLFDLHLQIFEYICIKNEIILKKEFVQYFLKCLVNNTQNAEYYVRTFLRLSNPSDVEMIPLIVPVLMDLNCILHKNCLVSFERLELETVFKVQCLNCEEEYKKRPVFESEKTVASSEEMSDKITAMVVARTSSGLSTDFEEKFLETRRKLILKTDNCLISVNSLQVNSSRIQIPSFYFSIKNQETKCHLIEFIPKYLNHSLNREYVVGEQNEIMWISLLGDNNKTVLECLLKQNLKKILRSIDKIEVTASEKADFHLACCKKMLELVKLNLVSKDHKMQSLTINLIFNFAKNIQNEEVLLNCFKLLIYFMVCNTSMVISETSLLTIEMCQNNRVTPLNLFLWYQTPILKTLVGVALANYCDDVPFALSLKTFATTLGFVETNDFIEKYYRQIIAIVLPYCIKIKTPNLMLVIEEINEILHNKLAETLSSSFLKVFPYVYMNESADVNNACIDYILQNTGSTLFSLMDQNSMKTITEFLIHYNKSPDFVMHAFKSMILTNNEPLTSTAAAEYISQKFLAVLNYFEYILLDMDRNNERAVRKEALLSLGGLVRLLGAQHLTSFQFKIMAVLKTAYSAQDIDLKDICLQVWKIFIFTADVSTLGPILSTIFVSLEVFLENYPAEVNEIYKYLVISNENLLSLHIPDLFFIEESAVNNEIKITVKTQTKRQKCNENFLENFQTHLEYITHEDSKVRIYGMKYFKKLMEQNRAEVNKMIVGQISINPMIEKLLEILIKNCKSEKPELQLIAAECLGEVGAVEPGLLPPNYAPQSPITSFLINSDEFAAMALKEFCNSYQFQTKSHFIDAYSLGIQEILKLRNVRPNENLNMAVWNVVSDRMRPFVIPLLTSRYAPMGSSNKIKSHPILGNSAKSFTEWSYMWASKLIEKITNEFTKKFLDGIKPAMRVDQRATSLFMPYILLHSIECSDPEDHKLIYEECNFIFETVLSQEHNHQIENLGELRLNEPRSHFIKSFSYVPLHRTKIKESLYDASVKSAKLIFQILDFLENYLRTRNSKKEKLYNDISTLLKKFDAKRLAQVNFKCGEFARALIYLETYIREDPQVRLQEELTFLAHIHAELGDPDSVEGLKHVKDNELSLAEQILVNNVTGRFQESTACFERMLQIGNVSSTDVKDVVNCYVSLDQPETALLVSESVMKKLFDDTATNLFNEIKAEPLWRLGRFEELEELLDNMTEESENFGLNCGKLFVKFRNADSVGFKKELKKSRMAILKVLKTSGAEQGAYLKSYPDVFKIHLLSEFEKAEECVVKLKEHGSSIALQTIQELVENWNCRLGFLQPTPNIMEQTLCIRRILLSEIKTLLKNNFSVSELGDVNSFIDGEIGQLWMKSTEYAINNKAFQQAQLYILNAETYQPKQLFLQKAIFLWEKGFQVNAIKVLEKGTSDLVKAATKDSTSTIRDYPYEYLAKEDRKLYSKGKLLIAQYNAEAGHVGFEKNIAFFKESVESDKECETNNLLFAAYLDKKLSLTEANLTRRDKDKQLLEIMQYYSRSMLHGCEFAYQSMPRFLTIWLDTTAQGKGDRTTTETYDKMNRTAEKLCKELPPYFFFTAFSQLVSRICHPNTDSYLTIKSIIIKLIQSYPQQSLWMLVSVYKSSYPIRVKRCSEILNDKRLKEQQMSKTTKEYTNVPRLIKDFNTLAEKFIDLTSKQAPGSIKFNVSELVPELPILLQSKKLMNIVLPIQRNLQLVRDCSQNTFTFPDQFVYFHSIEEEVEQLRSLQRPRKVKIIGSNGLSYNILLKHKDDLRKDFRFMEFNNVVREYLCKDPEARHRKLNIRGYAVIPLNEESGIIEWVPNLRTFKELINKQYKKCHTKTPTLVELREMNIETKPLENRRKIYLDLAKLHHPVFGDWFREQFPNPHNYFQARSAYVKSTAVMSIIGYILGLGDRHGENILFDASNGDTVHVDFNCLFNRGEGLGVPEVVPFRLTHNMVDAMGPLGIEGLFRKCCEITLRVLQKEKNTLMSFLRPFVYDPLVSWERTTDHRGEAERTDPKATHNVQNIEKRLNGIVRKFKGSSNIPLSTEGQVELIIQEATNVDNLAQMFYGWSSFM